MADVLVWSRKTKNSLLLMLLGAIGALVLEHAIQMFNSGVRSSYPYSEGPQQSSGFLKKPEKPDIEQFSSGDNEAKIYRFDGVRFTRLYGVCSWTNALACTTLKTDYGDTPIHIHALKDDGLVSGTLKREGRWEVTNTELIYEELKKDHELGFMDLGSHVGAFSLSMAKMGRKVVSVDPLIENVQRLCKSVQMGGLTDKVTIIFNPLSDKKKLVKFVRESGNVGGTEIVNSNLSSHKTKRICQDSVVGSYTVTLDDVLQFLPFSKAVIKIDIQQSEFAAFSGARAFFQRIEVPAILMEWVLMKTDRQGKLLVDMLLGYNYTAYEPNVGGMKLDPALYHSWPYDVMWRKA